MKAKDMKKKAVLLIEDNPDDVELTLRAFRKNNIANDIIVIEDGEKAINYLFRKEEYADRDPGELPSIILLDIKLPKIDGIEILRRIKADGKLKLIPVIILTSSHEEQDLVNSYSFGANSYIRKPVDFTEFMNVTQQLGVYWLMLNSTYLDFD